jgi:hypothetical protein
VFAPEQRRAIEKGSVRHLVEGEDSARTHQPRHRPQNGNGIGKKLQHETSHRCIEGLVGGDLGHIGLCEAHIVQPGLGHARPGSGDRAGVAFDAHHFSRGTDNLSCQHCYVFDAGTEIEDALSWTNTCFTEEPFGARSETRSLPNQALVLSVGAAQRILK